jgi:hypothetical protein
MTIPKTHPVQPLKQGTWEWTEAAARGTLITCGECGRSWDDGIPTGYTPAPSGRCPFESFHK